MGGFCNYFLLLVYYYYLVEEPRLFGKSHLQNLKWNKSQTCGCPRPALNSKTGKTNLKINKYKVRNVTVAACVWTVREGLHVLFLSQGLVAFSGLPEWLTPEGLGMHKQELVLSDPGVCVTANTKGEGLYSWICETSLTPRNLFLFQRQVKNKGGRGTRNPKPCALRSKYWWIPSPYYHVKRFLRHPLGAWHFLAGLGLAGESNKASTESVTWVSHVTPLAA